MSNHRTSGSAGHFFGWSVLTLAAALGTGCMSAPCEEAVCSEESDLALRDAGPPADGGSSRDGGTPGDGGAPHDGGTSGDGGTPGLSCDRLPHDSKLGTLKLHSKYVAAESVTHPQGMAPLTVVARKTGFGLYGVRRLDMTIHDLGTWPSITSGNRALAEIRAPEDRTGTTFLSNFLVNDGRRLLTGYIQGSSQLDGKVFLYDLEAPERSLHVAAPGNESALGVGVVSSGTSAFFVSSMGLGETASKDGELVLHVLDTRAEHFKTMPLATFDPEWAAAGAASTVTAKGIAVIGYFNGIDQQTHLRAVSPAVYAQALDTETPLALAEETEVHRDAPESVLVAGFGDGLAVHRGTLPDNDTVVDTKDVLLIPLTVGSGTRPKVRAGTATSLLVSQDTCTNVTSLASMGADLLVGVSDKNGQRLVRIKTR